MKMIIENMHLMNEKIFKALVVRQRSDGTYTREIAQRKIGDLPAGDVVVKVQYSSLNYKDALSASGNRGVTRRYPHTPGIDAAGVVEHSNDDRFKPNDEVVVSCYDLGMNVDGGFGHYIRVPAAWVMKRPRGLTLKETMIYGTGGFTAAHCIYRLQQHGVMPEKGKILVTGASGGVGSFSVAILAKLGYRVLAVSGNEKAHSFLLGLGAEKIFGRQDVHDDSGRAVLKGKWIGVIDTVGGNILATAIKSTKYGGVVTSCGNAGDANFQLNVYPFILRAVSLIGIDSAECPMTIREKIWRLISEWRIDCLADLCTDTTLDGLNKHIELMLAGKGRGRVVVDYMRSCGAGERLLMNQAAA